MSTNMSEASVALTALVLLLTIMSALVKSLVHRTAKAKDNIAQQNASKPNAKPNALCQVCGKRPRFKEGDTEYPYCGRTCARTVTGKSPDDCLKDGCELQGVPAYSGFCSKEHQRDEDTRAGAPSDRTCSQCKQVMQKDKKGSVCSSCEKKAKAPARPRPRKAHLNEMDPEGSTFFKVARRFEETWASKSGRPTVEKIFEIAPTREIQQRKMSFRRRLASALRVEEINTYHGALCLCDMGTKKAEYCSNAVCGICVVSKSAFEEFAHGKKYNTGRYGEGIYAYRNPAKADKWTATVTTSPYRVLIACTAVVEEGTLPVIPSGDASLNEDDLIYCQSADAMTPEYIIMYTL